MTDTDRLAEVRAAAENLEEAQARRLAAIRAAKDAKVSTVEQIAEAAGLTRDGVYKLLRAAQPQTASTSPT